MWNLRRGRDEAVQDDGDCGLKPETFQIVSQFANKKESVGTRNRLSAGCFDGCKGRRAVTD